MLPMPSFPAEWLYKTRETKALAIHIGVALVAQ
jgi:hypothetical protein